ncbi:MULTISPECIES: hypothetical protein [Paracoccus]|uniref:hypothetical protein n=1 Tax=Paracoccus TaxID=265 RepID=UPI001FB79970|nr:MULTISPECIES: hypothetical protein [Paracoccus]MCJ1900466.1 hypothetical protein [Paracoccus versutus]MDF3906041.1 hypothetical protein [Paracoccus sp. AS002]
MDTAYSINRHWSDRFIPEIRRIVGAHLLRVAPDYLDTRHATDLLMLDGRDMRIAARVRRHGYAGRYPYDFTIRSRLPSGNPTELAKIVKVTGCSTAMPMRARRALTSGGSWTCGPSGPG